MVLELTRADGKPRVWLALSLVGAAVIGISVSVVAEIWLLPAMTTQLVERFPEVRRYLAHGLAWSVLVFSCWQALLVLVLLAVNARRNHRAARALVRAMLSLLVAIVLLAIVGFVALVLLAFATPGAVLALGAMALVGAVGIVILWVHGSSR
ncbi:hypothetical protein [Microbacterium neimengense]